MPKVGGWVCDNGSRGQGDTITGLKMEEATSQKMARSF